MLYRHYEKNIPIYSCSSQTITQNTISFHIYLAHIDAQYTNWGECGYPSGITAYAYQTHTPAARIRPDTDPSVEARARRSPTASTRPDTSSRARTRAHDQRKSTRRCAPPGHGSCLRILLYPPVLWRGSRSSCPAMVLNRHRNWSSA